MQARIVAIYVLKNCNHVIAFLPFGSDQTCIQTCGCYRLETYYNKAVQTSTATLEAAPKYV